MCATYWRDAILLTGARNTRATVSVWTLKIGKQTSLHPFRQRPDPPVHACKAWQTFNTNLHGGIYHGYETEPQPPAYTKLYGGKPAVKTDGAKNSDNLP